MLSLGLCTRLGSKLAFVESSTFAPVQSVSEFAFIVSGGADVLFSQIFSGVPQLYAGSSFEVEEIFEGEIEILEPSLIDVDLRWLPPKFYFGTWTISDTLPGFGVASEDRGFVDSSTFKIKRYSRFTVQANADVPIAMLEESSIDNCNFALATVSTPPLPAIIGTVFPVINNGLLKTRETLRKVPLKDRVFIPKLRYVGLYINVGCCLTKAKYTARIINGISVDLSPFAFDNCLLVPLTTCDLEFTTFINATPNSFRTQGEADNWYDTVCGGGGLPGSGVFPLTWTCSINNADVRTYYQGYCVGN